MVTLKDQYGNKVTSGADSTANVTASIKPGDAWTIGGATTKAAIAGVATFDNLTHTGRQLGAKVSFAKGAVTADSNAFDLVFPVSDLTAVPRDTKVNLSFTAPSGATAVALHKSSTSATEGFSDTGVALASGSASAVVEGLANGTHYWFKLMVTGGLFAGDSNIATAVPSSVAASVVSSSTAGGDGKVNIAEKASGFNVVAQSTVSSGKLYLVSSGAYSEESELASAAVSSAVVSAANADITLAVGAENALITDGTTYRVYAVNEYGTLSSGVTAFTADLSAPALAGAYPQTANVGTASLDLKIKATETGRAYYVILADGAAAPSVAQVKAGTDASNGALAANLKGDTALTANVETTVDVAGLDDGRAYDIYAVVEDGALNLSSAAKAEAATTMILNADANDNNVDNNIVITFNDNPSWRGAVSSVKIGATTLAAAAPVDYALGAGTLTLYPATGRTELKTPGSWNITVEATGYATSVVNQTVHAGAAVSSRTIVSAQPVVGLNGALFTTQPVVTLKDQYDNVCASGASAMANVTATAKSVTGTWTLGGTATVMAANGIATFTGLWCTTVTPGSGAITFSSGSATVDSASFTLPQLPATALVADAANNNVDNDIDITFAEDAVWRGKISAVKLGGTALTATTDYVISACRITLRPSGGNALLRAPGTWAITVEASGYATSSVDQTVTHGALHALAVTAQPSPGTVYGGAFAGQPVVALKDRYNNTITGGAEASANVTVAIKSGDSWTIGGTVTKAAAAGVVTFDNLTHTGRQSGAGMSFASGSVTASSAAFDLVFPAGDLAAVSRDGKVNVTFTAPSGATSVELHKSSTSATEGFSDSGLALNAASSSAAVTGLTNGTQYWFKLVVTGGLYAGASNVDTAIPLSVVASVTAASTAGGDGRVNMAEKASGFNVVARSTASSGKLYLVPSGSYEDEAALIASAVTSATAVTAANTDTTISVAGNNSSITDNSTYQVYAVNEYGTLSTGVTAFTAELVAPSFAVAYPQAANVGTTTLDVKIKATETGIAYYVILSDGAASPSAAQIKAGTDAANGVLEAEFKGNTALTADVEATVNVTGLNDGRAYDIYVATEDAALNLSSAAKADAATTMILNADASDNNVDNNIVITFNDNASWRGAVTAVKIGATTLATAAPVDYALGAGTLTLYPSTGRTELKTPGSWNITVEVTGYATSSVSQTVNAGAAVTANSIVSTQPVIGSNGASFTTQPVVTLKDQYGNTCSSGPSSAAQVTASAKSVTGSWTIGGTTAVNAVNGVATYAGLTCTTTTSGTGATTFTSGAAVVDSAAFTLPQLPAVTLTADPSNNDVDNNIEVTFIDDAVWRGKVTAVKIGAVTLTPSTDYTLASGKLTLLPSGGNAALRTPGAWPLTVVASGYADSTASQTVNAGALASLAVTTQPVPGVSSPASFSTQPAVALKDQYGNTITSGVDSAANVVASIKAGDAWAIGGTLTRAASAGVAIFGDLTHTGRQFGAKITFTKASFTADSQAFDLVFPVSDLAAVSRDGKVELTFTAPAGASSVQLHKSSTSASEGFADTGVALTAASASATVNGLTNDVQYWFKLVVAGGVYAGDSNVVNSKPESVTATVTGFSTAGGDGRVNISEKAAGFIVVAQSSASSGTLYLVPANTYASESALVSAKVSSASVAAANSDTTITVAAANAAINDNATYQVYAVNSSGTLSAGVTAFTTDLTAPSLSTAQKTTSNSDALYARANDTITYTLNMSESVSATINAGAAMTNVTGAVNDIATSQSATKTITGTVNAGDNGAVALGAGSYTFADAAGNTLALAFSDINSAASNAITADTTAPAVAFSYNPVSPVKAGSVTITAAFGEGVKTGMTPQISIDQQGASDISGANMSASDGERKVWTYVYTVNTADGGNYIDGSAVCSLSAVTDAAGNVAQAPTNGTFVVDTASPAILSASLAGDNSYIDIAFSEGVYKTGSAALTASEFALTFAQNGGTATNVTISSVKKNDNTVESSATTLAGGETVVRAFLSITGIPSGVETIEIKPASAAAIYDAASNAMSGAQTAGVKTLAGQVPPAITDASRSADNAYVDVTFSKGVYNGTGGALTSGAFAVTFARNGGNATNAGIVTVTKTDATSLAGGETAIRFNLSITGIPSGVETISIKPSSGASVYDSTANAMPDTLTSPARTLNDKLAPSDPTLPQLELISFNNVTGVISAASEVTSSESSYLDVYISSASPDGASVPTASEASASTTHNGTLMTVGGVPKPITDSIYYRFRDAAGNRSNWVRKCTVGLTPGTYKKSSAPNPTVSGDSYLSGNTLQVGNGTITQIYDLTYNQTAKNIMNAIETADSFTVDANGLISAIDDSQANDGAANSVVLASADCPATVNIAAAAYQLTLTGSATAVTMQKGIIDITGLTATTFNRTATGSVKAIAAGKTLAAVSGAQTIEIAGASAATVSGAVTTLTISGAVTTITVSGAVTTLNVGSASQSAAFTVGALSVGASGSVTTLNVKGSSTTPANKPTVTTLSTVSTGTLTTVNIGSSANYDGAVGTLSLVSTATSVNVGATGDITTAVNIPSGYAGTWTSSAKNLTAGSFAIDTTAALGATGIINLNASDNSITTAASAPVTYQNTSYSKTGATVSPITVSSTTSTITSGVITLSPMSTTLGKFYYGTSSNLQVTGNQSFTISVDSDAANPIIIARN